MKRQSSFTAFTCRCIETAKYSGRYSTAHLYKNALRSYSQFCHRDNVLFSDITREQLLHYYKYLTDNHLKLNTISTYMRMLRSLYNKAVDKKLAPNAPRLFHDVYTGVDTNCKKAISAKQLHILLYHGTSDKGLVRTQHIARLLFGFCGMSFTDFAHLKPSNFSHGVLEYNRIKTKTKISVQYQNKAKQMCTAIENTEAKPSSCSPYMFNVLSGRNKMNGYDEYREYQSCLRTFNSRLKCLARQLGLSCHISSYTLRHSWATIAKYLGTPIEQISEMLGHTSIKTTQIYLKSFNADVLGKVNQKTFDYISEQCV